jgi:hypothetical protein
MSRVGFCSETSEVCIKSTVFHHWLPQLEMGKGRLKEIDISVREKGVPTGAT